MKNPRLTLVILFAMLLIITVSCGKKEEPQQQKKIVVVTTLFPLYDFAKNVAPEETEVTLLLPPGVEAHAYEPKPGDMAKISSARVFIYTGRYMEPWAQPLISGAGNKGLIVTDASRGIDLMETREGNHSHDGEKGPHKEKHHHGAYDPHIWLDLENAGHMVDNITEGLSTADATAKTSTESGLRNTRKNLPLSTEGFAKLWRLVKRGPLFTAAILPSATLRTGMALNTCPPTKGLPTRNRRRRGS